tara:strand:+ start:634 stop:948 length:315 start_codon:yes stop_codon:yes gene_type:complete
MKVILSSINEFVDELKFLYEDEEKPLVRCTTFVSDDSDDGFAVFLYASFIIDDGTVCELELFCGKNLNQRYQIGSDKAVELTSELKNKCSEIGVTVRPGRFEVD